MSHLMINRRFGQRWDGEGEELAVAVFVHDLLHRQREMRKRRRHLKTAWCSQRPFELSTVCPGVCHLSTVDNVTNRD